MQAESPQKIRNLAVAGHNDAGKTTLCSALLYAGGVINRLNRVEDGNTTTDFDHEEIHRQISIGLAPCFVPWDQHKINLIDAPGYSIFFSETQAAVRATDAVLLCVNAVAGIEVVTELVWQLAEEMQAPVMVHLTKMDRERANFGRNVRRLRKNLDRGIVPLQIPIGKESAFEGLADLLSGKAHRFTPDGDGRGQTGEAPDAEGLAEWREDLIEAVAETDDALLEKYLDKGELTSEELAAGLRAAIRDRKLFPVTMSSAAHGIGSSSLLDSVVQVMPTPLDRGTFPAFSIGDDPVELEVKADGPPCALAFKTLSDPFSGKISILRVVSGELTSDHSLWNTQHETEERLGHLLALQGKQGTEIGKLVAGDIGGVAKLKQTHSGDTLCSKERPIKLGWIDLPETAISFAIEPKSKGDEEKIGEALGRLMEEDLSLLARRDERTAEYLIAGAGRLHVEIGVAKLKQRFGVEVILHPPKVPYRETIRRPADGHGRHKKQTGGRGQFADCRIHVEPLPRGGDFEFLDEIFGGAIPQTYRPAVEKGIQEARTRGYLAGYPMVDFRVRLKDGQFHDVDSSEMAFKIAGSLAFKDAMSKAAVTLLEPMMEVVITTSEDFTGDIMGDLSQRRGRPQGMETKNGNQEIKATVPMSEMLNYAPALNSMTQGRAHFHTEFSHYEEVPRNVQEKLIAESKKHDDG